MRPARSLHQAYAVSRPRRYSSLQPVERLMRVLHRCNKPCRFRTAQQKPLMTATAQAMTHSHFTGRNSRQKSLPSQLCQLPVPTCSTALKSDGTTKKASR